MCATHGSCVTGRVFGGSNWSWVTSIVTYFLLTEYHKMTEKPAIFITWWLAVGGNESGGTTSGNSDRWSVTACECGCFYRRLSDLICDLSVARWTVIGSRCAKLLNYRPPSPPFKSCKPIESTKRLAKAKKQATENWIGLSLGRPATGSKAKIDILRFRRTDSDCGYRWTRSNEVCLERVDRDSRRETLW